MNHPLIECGHAANSTHDGKPSCVICVCTGDHQKALTVAKVQPDLQGEPQTVIHLRGELPQSTQVPRSDNDVTFQSSLRLNQKHFDNYCLLSPTQKTALNKKQKNQR